MTQTKSQLLLHQTRHNAEYLVRAVTPSPPPPPPPRVMQQERSVAARVLSWFRMEQLRFLEGESAAGGVAHFVQVWVAGKLDHGWRSAHEDEGVVAGGRQVVSDHVLADEALTVVPPCNTHACHTPPSKKNDKPDGNPDKLKPSKMKNILNQIMKNSKFN